MSKDTPTLKLIIFALVLIACSTTSDIAEVTSVVPETSGNKNPSVVEVTREVVVTRIVEVAITAPLAPTQISVATPANNDQIRADFVNQFISSVERFDDVERVNSVSVTPGRMEVELYTDWYSRDSQPDVTWIIVTSFAETIADMSPSVRSNLTGIEDFVLALTTYSSDGRFRFQSETNYDTFVRLANRTITNNEWQADANAGFR